LRLRGETPKPLAPYCAPCGKKHSSFGDDIRLRLAMAILSLRSVSV
jgi:hypothetical protein